MTKEQLLVYLYGIYPDGGVTEVAILVVLAILGVYFIVYGAQLDVAFKEEEKENLKKSRENFFQKSKKWLYLALAVIVLGYFVPSKKTFIAILATPTIVQSYKDSNGTLHRTQNIVELILEKTEKRLKEELLEK